MKVCSCSDLSRWGHSVTAEFETDTRCVMAEDDKADDDGAAVALDASAASAPAEASAAAPSQTAAAPLGSAEDAEAAGTPSRVKVIEAAVFCSQ